MCIATQSELVGPRLFWAKSFSSVPLTFAFYFKINVVAESDLVKKKSVLWKKHSYCKMVNSLSNYWGH